MWFSFWFVIVYSLLLLEEGSAEEVGTAPGAQYCFPLKSSLLGE